MFRIARSKRFPRDHFAHILTKFARALMASACFMALGALSGGEVGMDHGTRQERPGLRRQNGRGVGRATRTFSYRDLTVATEPVRNDAKGATIRALGGMRTRPPPPHSLPPPPHPPPPPPPRQAMNGAHQLDRAYRHIESIHLAPCSRALVYCMGLRGISNDLNAAVRALWLALSEGRQLVIPGESWHWLDEATPLSDVLVPSRCQRRLRQRRRRRVDAASCSIANASLHAGSWHNGSWHTCEAAAVVQRQLGAGVNAPWHTSMPVRCASKGHGPTADLLWEQDVPAEFRPLGLLWWMQALSTYLLRLRGRAAARLQAHQHLLVDAAALRAAPALSPPPPSFSALASAGGEPIDEPAPPERQCSLLEHQAALQRATLDGAGWLPGARFGLALHARWGDACGGKVLDFRRRCHELIEQSPGRRKGHKALKKGVPSLRLVAARLAAHRLRAASTYLATDSQVIATQAAEGVASATLGAVRLLNISRAKYEPPKYDSSKDNATRSRLGLKPGDNSRLWIENFATGAGTRAEVFDETMLDLLLLSRAPVIAGQMLGNMPRLAMQLRVSWPPVNRTSAQWPEECSYVSLDGRAWCPGTICRYAKTSQLGSANATTSSAV